MSATPIVLFDTQYAPDTDTAMFTSPGEGSGTIVDKLSAYNSDSVTRTVTVRVVPSGETPTGTDFTVVTKQIAAGSTYLFPEVVGQLINADGALYVQASAPGVIVMRCNGRNYTET